MLPICSPICLPGHRVATPLSYFISELLYVPKSQLDNIREIPLIVVTVTTSESNTPEEDINRSIPPPVKRPRLLSEGDIARLLSMTRAWVLDFDLDFFSTGNPYRGPLTEVHFKILRTLISCQNMPLSTFSTFSLIICKPRVMGYTHFCVWV